MYPPLSPVAMICLLLSLGMRRLRRGRADPKEQGGRDPRDMMAVGEARTELDGSHETHLELMRLRTSRVLPNHAKNSE